MDKLTVIANATTRLLGGLSLTRLQEGAFLSLPGVLQHKVHWAGGDLRHTVLTLETPIT